MEIEAKKCSRCKQIKQRSQFYRKSSNPDGLDYHCKDCQNSYAKIQYGRNKAVYIEKAKRNKAKQVAKLVPWIVELKSRPCMDCGGKFPPYVMDFDHLDPDLKVSNISAMVNVGMSQEVIQRELNKCELVCSNCHRIRSFKRGSLRRIPNLRRISPV